VTLKLKPLPEDSALVVVRCEAAGVAAVLDALHTGATRPVCVDLLNPRAAVDLPAGKADAWAVVVGYEESAEAVRWQVQQLTRELSGQRTVGIDTLTGAAAESVWDALGEFQRRPDATLTFKANLLAGAVAAFCQLAGRLDDTLSLQAHAGNGIVIGHVTGERTPEQAQSLLQGLQREAEAARGNVVVRQCPPAWKSALPIWGSPRGDVGLMRAVRDKLDPRRLFNPGRFLV
jgi:glycolate oxidase FAD binding subunit